MLFAKVFLVIMLNNAAAAAGIATIPMASIDGCRDAAAQINGDHGLPAVAICISTGFEMPGTRG